METSCGVSGMRARLANDLESQYDTVVSALKEAMESTKKAWAYCPSCRKKVQVDHPDHGARIKAVELWLEQGFGRPGTGAAAESAISLGAIETREQFEALTFDELTALLWTMQDEEERSRQRRFLNELASAAWPDGFAAALERLEQLAAREKA
jgi:hypothetical protein